MATPTSKELLQSKLGELHMNLDGVDMITDSSAVVGMDGERRGVSIYESSSVQKMLAVVDEASFLAEKLENGAAEAQTSLQIEEAMKRMADQLNTREIADWCDLAKAVTGYHRQEDYRAPSEYIRTVVWAELTDRIVKSIRSHGSKWSGGHSISNVADQIKRDVAIALLDRQSSLGRKIDATIKQADLDKLRQMEDADG